MSIHFLKDLFHLFYPNTCCGCEQHLSYNESILCVFCRHDLPYSNFSKHSNNPMEQAFFGRIPIVSATALLLFHQQGIAQRLIHALKYNNQTAVGVFTGNLLYAEMKQSKRFKGLDCVIPVPLHPKKQKKRGYNQLTTFGNTLAHSFDIPYMDSILIKRNTSASQTKKIRWDRFKNDRSEFALTDKKRFENKHVLLIDDVMTTGATLEACCLTLLETSNIKLSIATIAYTD